MNLDIKLQSILADALTPVGIYLNIREKYKNTLLLESSDYHSNKHHYSYICFEPIASFKVIKGHITSSKLDKETLNKKINDKQEVIRELGNFARSFKGEKLDNEFMTNMILGYTTYESVEYFEDITLNASADEGRSIPELYYQLFKYILVYNHKNNQLHIVENSPKGEVSKIDEVIDFISKPFVGINNTSFNTVGEIHSNLTDQEYMDMVDKGIKHCLRGDVFQIVLSRRFSQKYEGDLFKVYRSLRSVNPSPYLFYFDYEDYKIVGSSPEAQLVVSNNNAIIHPIAGTFKRTGNDKQDYDLAKKLFDDEKENSEHVMLVDLARNDLSRHGHKVHVTSFKDIQFYSHVCLLYTSDAADD